MSPRDTPAAAPSSAAPKRRPKDPPQARLFVALVLDDRHHDALSRWVSQWQWSARAAMVPPANWHLTLHFIGSVAVGRAADIGHALAAVAMPPLSLRLMQGQLWRGGMAVVRAAADPALDALHADVVRALAPIGLASNDPLPFKPHVTLARHAPGSVPPAQPLELAWQVDRFALVRSVLPPQVPRTRYDPLAWFPAR